MKNLPVTAILIIALCACEDDEPGVTPDALVIGGVFHDEVSDSARKRLIAVRMAVDEINASGALGRPLAVVNLSPAIGDTVDTAKAADNARELHDEHGAVGVVSLFSSVGRAIIGVTQAAGYDDFVQCSCSATSPAINDPAAPDSDRNDTFYRTVVNDNFQGRLLARLIESSGAIDVGIYRIDDPYGSGLRDVVVNELAALGTFNIRFDQTHPAGTFDVTANEAAMDQIITLSQTNQLDVLVLPTLKAQAPSIIKYLTENGYAGALMLSDGAKATETFQIAVNLGSWLGGSNVILGTEPDNYAGESSTAFSSAYTAAFGESAETFSSTAYDCTYTMALALLYAGASGYSAAGVKANLPEFKEENRTTDEVTVGIGSSEFSRAAEAIAAGQRVSFEGASGGLIFDAVGDRPRQGMRTFGPNSGVTDWEIRTRYDEQLTPR